MIELKDVPFNMNYTILDNLRDEPIDFAEMQKGILFLIKDLETIDSPVEKAIAQSRIGVFQRMCWQLDKAETSLKEAFEILRENRYMPGVVNTGIRLAHVYHWKEEYGKAEELFTRCLDICRKSNDNNVKKYESFCLQHLGKCRFDQAMFNDALNFFLGALDLRLLEGNLDLINSTRHAITIAKEKADNV